MSRIGSKSIKLPKGVTLTIQDGLVKAKGPNEETTRPIAPHTQIVLGEKSVSVTRDNESKAARSCHGMMRSLLNNMVVGVSVGFVKRLEIDGVGYKAEIQGKKLVLSLGFSHTINYKIPVGISIKTESGKKNTVVAIHGVDKEKVGQIAAEIRSFRPPDSYKGKGVKYAGEKIVRKEGKKK